MHRPFLQAQRLATQATSQLQETYDRSGHCSQRKRKLTEASNTLTQQIGEVLAEGEDYAQKSSSQVSIPNRVFSASPLSNFALSSKDSGQSLLWP